LNEVKIFRVSPGRLKVKLVESRATSESKSAREVFIPKDGNKHSAHDKVLLYLRI
jgi:hypothetical protein